MIDYTQALKKIVPPRDGESPTTLRSATVAAVNAGGTVNVTLAGGVTIEDVPVLNGASLTVGAKVEMLAFRGGLLVLGVTPAATVTPVASVLAGTGTGTTTSTSFTNTITGSGSAGGVHGVAFTAPPSGAVFIVVRATASNSNAGVSSLLDIEVREGSTVGSGTVTRAAAEAQAGIFQSSTAGQPATITSTALVTGLTAGSVYNAALAYRATANTSTYSRRWISVLPQ